MADFKKLKDGEGNSYNVKDETARTNLASHTGSTSNPHSVTKAQVGLGNSDNTSDENKPISNAQALVNATKFDKANVKSTPSATPSDDNVLSEKAIVDNFTQAIKITSQNTTLGDISTQLNTINTNGEHVFFDVSALGASMYLCTIYINTTDNIFRIFDMVTNRISEGTYDATKLLSMAIANASGIATQSQIDHLQEEVDELGGTSVIENWDALGDLIKSGNSTNVISPGDKIDVNWIKTVLGTTTSGLTVSCSDMNAFITKLGKAEAGVYLFVYNGTAWTYDETVITLSEWGLSVSGTIPTGEVMSITTTVDCINYTFTSYDDFTPDDTDVPHNWCLEQTYAPSTKAYDTYEALFSVYEGKTIPAGKYYLTLYSYYYGENRKIYFEVLSSLTASATAKIQFASTGYRQVTLGESTKYVVNGIRPYAINDTANPLAAAITCYYDDTITTPGDYTDLTTLGTDVIYSGSTDKAMFGSNTWEYSNMRAWLNNEDYGDTYVATHPCDRPSDYNKSTGFLWGIDPRAKALIQSCEIKYTAGRDNPDRTYNTTYTVHDKVFLLSMKEMSFNINTDEGNATDLYSEYCSNTLTNGAVVARVKYNRAGGSLNSYRWSRSAIASYAYGSRIVRSSGSDDNNYAVGGYYYAPAFIIGKAS